MEKITTLRSEKVFLKDFGYIQIDEGSDGRWHIDLFPRGSENDEEKILLESTMRAGSDKYFSGIGAIRHLLNKEDRSC